jgi:hypothetical protein
MLYLSVVLNFSYTYLLFIRPSLFITFDICIGIHMCVLSICDIQKITFRLTMAKYLLMLPKGEMVQ